jgi:SH3 domain protein
VRSLIAAFFCCIFITDSVQATTVYVTDNLSLSLRSEENPRSKVLKLLPTGTPLTVIKENSATGFSRVRLNDGMEGFIPIRNTMKELPSRFQLDTVTKNLSALQSENSTLKAELSTLKESITPGTPLEQSLANERDQLSQELNELKKASANVLQLKNERDELQERVVNVERDMQQMKLENQSLKDTSKQDWFLYGGLLALFGVILGFVLPKIGWRRKRGWDSF